MTVTFAVAFMLFLLTACGRDDAELYEAAGLYLNIGTSVSLFSPAPVPEAFSRLLTSDDSDALFGMLSRDFNGHAFFMPDGTAYWVSATCTDGVRVGIGGYGLMTHINADFPTVVSDIDGTAVRAYAVGTALYAFFRVADTPVVVNTSHWILDEGKAHLLWLVQQFIAHPPDLSLLDINAP